MLVKVEDGFYLNSQHIIAVRISKSVQDGAFVVAVEYTPNSAQHTGLYEKHFTNGIEAEVYLQNLHQTISKS
jgi:hypothetical protein